MNEREKLIEKNLPLVHSCAKRFKNRGVEYDDLYQAGCVGLVKAVNGFDSTLGFEFSTYAVPAILGEIRRIFRDGGAVKVSRSIKEKSRIVWQEKEKLSDSIQREPTVKELADYMKADVCEISELLLAFQPVLSLTSGDEDNDNQLDIPVENQDKIDEKICLEDCLGALCENDRKIIDLRYYKAKTQSAVAREMGMSQVQISRREKKILSEIREKMSV
jgi:RNA polymerase sporulation-specific sigma factor